MSLSRIMIIVIIMSDCVIKVCSNRDMKVCLVTEIQGIHYIYVQGSMIRIWILTFVDSVFNKKKIPSILVLCCTVYFLTNSCPQSSMYLQQPEDSTRGCNSIGTYDRWRAYYSGSIRWKVINLLIFSYFFSVICFPFHHWKKMKNILIIEFCCTHFLFW